MNNSLNKLTPMMQQFKNIKEEHPDTILFFRVGDFYEMFFEDAVIASKELEIALTSRNTDKENAIPLAGVPYHSVQSYISRLLENGHKVAICEQVEEASQAKGLVRREVSRIITPGTRIEDSLLDDERNNYLAAIFQTEDPETFGLTFIDVSTGELQVYFFEGNNALSRLFDEIERLQPAEIIFEDTFNIDMHSKKLFKKHMESSLVNLGNPFSNDEEAIRLLQEQFDNDVLQNTGLMEFRASFISAALALKYIKNMQKSSLGHIRNIKFSREENAVILDAITVRNLEIIETMRTKEKKNSLFGVLDRTKTAMGKRLLRKWLERPLLKQELIELRWQAVEEFKDNHPFRSDLGKLLSDVYDLERLSSRLNLGYINPRDLLSLKKTLLVLPHLKGFLSETESKLLQKLNEQIPDFSELAQELEMAISEDAPFTIKEGGIFKEGYSQEIDELRMISRNSKAWMLEFEEEEKKRTGIKSLKIGYNKVFGYYIEITRANLELVPVDYIRKQTLVNAERFITEELKEKEDLILNAEEKLGRLEYKLFEELRLKTVCYTEQIQSAAQVMGTLDCLFAFAEAASAYGYIKPVLTTNNTIKVINGRHPVVERTAEDPFIPNDLFMGPEKERVLLITGPNMAGKSTYCRSAALLLIMAQAGSFVPADEMEFQPVERIFTRVGASDDLSSGRSTFMVEMEETASILSSATPRSIVILDEIGRGTSTYDGMSLARAILEYLHDRVKAKVLFSSHYHELTSLEEKLEGLVNYTVSVKEIGEDVVFLRKVVQGKADKSYGVNVARLAGLPEDVLDRAREILAQLEEEFSSNKENGEKQGDLLEGNNILLKEGQLAFFPGEESKKDKASQGELTTVEKQIIQEIKKMNMVNTTPLRALNKLFAMQKRILKKL